MPHPHAALPASPADLFGQLFRDVQLSQLFPDNKTFVDCTPRRPPKDILSAYLTEKEQTSFDLKTFVEKHFELPKVFASGFVSDRSDSVEAHIQKLWPVLTRQPEAVPAGSSLLALPFPYIVPGGRFGEIYYWDSYFTMLGFEAMGNFKVVEEMTDNFAHLIQTYGHVPNGNRTYFLSRSQPPFFALLVEMLVKNTGVGAYRKYLPALQQEYAFWMDGDDALASARRRTAHRRTAHRWAAHRRAVCLPDGTVLNRYWDDSPTPRPESYFEDVELAKTTAAAPETLFLNLRAACESGWDFSSRWFADASDLGSIRTVELLPVDLNCLLYQLELTLANAYKITNDEDNYGELLAKAQQRSQYINEYCWNETTATYQDYDWINSQTTGIESLAMVYPLFTKIASQARAAQIAVVLERNFLKKGGLVTTLTQTGQQWDSPNGWACLQWVAIVGLRNYGFDALAETIKKRWMNANEIVFKKTGKMLEKYNVEDPNTTPTGGEYGVQDGFGWTNGLYLKLITEQKMPF